MLQVVHGPEASLKQETGYPVEVLTWNVKKIDQEIKGKIFRKEKRANGI